MVWCYSSLLTGVTSRPDFYGGKSELSTARDWLDDDATDLRRDGSIWTMRVCTRGTGGGSAVRKVWLQSCWSCSDPPGHNYKHASGIWRDVGKTQGETHICLGERTSKLKKNWGKSTQICGYSTFASRFNITLIHMHGSMMHCEWSPPRKTTRNLLLQNPVVSSVKPL